MEFMLEIHSDSPKMGMGPQKSPVRCVWGNRNGLTRRTVTLFAFEDSYGPKDVRESLYWYPKSSKKFCETLKSDHSSPKGLILHHFTFKIGIKLQKCALRCILKRSNRLRRRTVTQFTFTDSFGPEDNCEKLQCHLKLPRNFLKHFELPWFISQK